MRVLIFEPQHAGHNLAYVSHICAGLQSLDCEIHLATSRQAAESEQFEKHLGNCDDLRVQAIDGFRQRSGCRSVRVNGPGGFRSLNNGLWQALHTVRPDHLFIPFGNPLASWYGLPNRVCRYLRSNHIETEIILLFGRYSYPCNGAKSRLKQHLALSLLQRGPWTRIHHILPHAVETMRAFSDALASKVNFLPDPVDVIPKMDREQARRLLGIPLDGRYVGLLGLIEQRKGVYQLLSAFRDAINNLQPNDRLLLAGKAVNEVSEVLAERYSDLVASKRVINLDKHLSTEEFDAACNASNLICTPYPAHKYSASIVLRAAAADVPVLGNAVGWMDETIREHQLGTTCNTNDPACFATQLVESIEASESYQPSEKARQLAEYHSVTNFTTKLVARVAERITERNATRDKAQYRRAS